MTVAPAADTLLQDAGRLIELVRTRRARAARHLRAVDARVHRVPALEPPLDPPADPRYAPIDEPAHQLRLVVPDVPLPFDETPPAAAPRATGHHSASSASQPGSTTDRTESGTPAAYDDDFWSPQHTGRHQLPEPTAMVWRFMQALLETFDGRRPLAQLRGWVSPAIYSGLTRATTTGRLADAPGGAASPAARTPGTVRSVRVCEPADGVAEVSVVVRHGGRYRAVAARFEGIDGRWRCVLLQVG